MAKGLRQCIIESMPQKKKRISHHIDKRIVMRFRIFALLTVIFAGILAWDLMIGTISLPFLLVGVLAGTGIGIVVSRMYHLSWDHDGKKVVGRLDKIGIAVLILYILFAFFRKAIVGVFVHGPMLGTVTIAVMAGLFIGQIVGSRNGVRGILRDEGIIK